MSFTKLKGSVSDADILINLAKVDKLDILEQMFDQIVIPQKILEEISKHDRKNTPKVYTKIHERIYSQTSVFETHDRRKNKDLNRLAKDAIEHYQIFIGPGEAECTGYARAFNIHIIVSDNIREFKEMEKEFIMLSHNDLLSLCVKYGLITSYEGESIYRDINRYMTNPPSDNFSTVQDKSITKIFEMGWNKPLGL